MRTWQTHVTSLPHPERVGQRQVQTALSLCLGRLKVAVDITEDVLSLACYLFYFSAPPPPPFPRLLHTDTYPYTHTHTHTHTHIYIYIERERECVCVVTWNKMPLGITVVVLYIKPLFSFFFSNQQSAQNPVR